LAWAATALEGAGLSGNLEEQAAAHLAIGHTHLGMGLAQEACKDFSEARSLSGTCHSFFELEAVEGLAIAARRVGDPNLAADALEAAMHLRERLASAATRTRVAAMRIRSHLEELEFERDRARQAQAKAEAALRDLHAAQAELLQAQQRAMASQLMTSLAHQLNTPLGNCLTANSCQQDGLAGFSQRMREGALRRSELEVFVKQGRENNSLVASNLFRLQSLVERFKRFGSHHFVTRERLTDLIREAASKSELRAGLNPGSGVSLDVDTLELHCDRQALQGLLAELLDNALKARRPSDPPIEVLARRHDERLEIQVKDHGPGMSAAQLARLSNPYQDKATASTTASLGLGWPIVHHLARQLSTTPIELHSSPDDGTCVRLQLPLRP
jgi:signal transduction histidine kinase